MTVERKWSTTTVIEEGVEKQKSVGEWVPSDPQLDGSYVALQPGNYKPREDLTPYKGKNLTSTQLQNYHLPIPLGIGEEEAVVHVYPQGTIEVHGKVYAWNKLVKPGIYSRFEKLRYLNTNVEIRDRQNDDDYKHHAAYNRTIKVPNKWVKSTRKYSNQSILEYTFVEFHEQIKTEKDGVMYPIPVLNGLLTIYPDGTFKTEGVVVDSVNHELMDDYGYLGDQSNYTNYPTFINNLTKDDINPKNVYKLISINDDDSVTYGAIELNQQVSFSDYPKLPSGILPVNDGKVTINPIGELIIQGLVITDKGHPIKEGRYKNINEILIGWKLKQGSDRADYEYENEEYVNTKLVYNPMVELEMTPRVVGINNRSMLYVVDPRPKYLKRRYQYHYQNDSYHLIDVPELNGQAVRYEPMKGWDTFSPLPVDENASVYHLVEFKNWVRNNFKMVYNQFYNEGGRYLGEYETYPLIKSTRILIGNKYKYPHHRFNPLGRIDEYATFDHTDFQYPEGISINDTVESTTREKYATPVQIFSQDIPREDYFQVKTLKGEAVYFTPYGVNPFGSAYYRRLKRKDDPLKPLYPENHGQVFFEKEGEKIFANITPPCILKYGERYFTLEAGRVRIDNLHETFLEGELDNVSGYLDNGPLYFRKKKDQSPREESIQGETNQWIHQEREEETYIEDMDENHVDDQDGLTFHEQRGLLGLLRRDITAYLTSYEKALINNTDYRTPYYDIVEGKVKPFHGQALGVVYKSEDNGIMLTYYGFRYNDIFPMSWNINSLMFTVPKNHPSMAGIDPTLPLHYILGKTFYYNRDQEYITTQHGLKMFRGQDPLLLNPETGELKWNNVVSSAGQNYLYLPHDTNRLTLHTSAGSQPIGLINGWHIGLTELGRLSAPFTETGKYKLRTIEMRLRDNESAEYSGAIYNTRLGKDGVFMYHVPGNEEEENGMIFAHDERPFWILSKQPRRYFSLRLYTYLPPNFKIYYRFQRDTKVYTGEMRRVEGDIDFKHGSADSERYSGDVRHLFNSGRMIYQLNAEDILPYIPESRKTGYVDIFLDNPFDEDQRIYQHTDTNNPLPIKPLLSPYSFRVYFRRDDKLAEIKIKVPEDYPTNPITNMTEKVKASVEKQSWVYLQDITEYPERLVKKNGLPEPVTYIEKLHSGRFGLADFKNQEWLVGHTYRIRVVDSFGATNYIDFTVEKHRWKIGDKINSLQLFGIREYVYPVHAQPNFDHLPEPLPENMEHEGIRIQSYIQFDIEKQQYRLWGIWYTASGQLLEEGLYEIGETPPIYTAQIFTPKLFEKHQLLGDIQPLMRYRGKPAYQIEEYVYPPFTQLVKPDNMMYSGEGADDVRWLVSPIWRESISDDVIESLEGYVGRLKQDEYLRNKRKVIFQSIFALGKDPRVAIISPKDSYGNINPYMIGRDNDHFVVPPYFYFRLLDGSILYGYADFDTGTKKSLRVFTLDIFLAMLHSKPSWLIATEKRERQVGDPILERKDPQSPQPLTYVELTDHVQAREYQHLSPKWIVPTFAIMDETNLYEYRVVGRDDPPREVKTSSNHTTVYDLIPDNWERILEQDEYSGEPHRIHFTVDYSYALRKPYEQQVEENNAMDFEVYHNWKKAELKPEVFGFDDRTLGWVEYHKDGKTITVHGRVLVNGKYTKNKDQTVSSIDELEFLEICLDSFYTLYDNKGNHLPVLRDDDKIELDNRVTWLYNQGNPCNDNAVPPYPDYKEWQGILTKVETYTDLDTDRQPLWWGRDLKYKFTVANIRESEVDYLIINDSCRYQYESDVMGERVSSVDRSIYVSFFAGPLAQSRNITLTKGGGHLFTLTVIEPWSFTHEIDGERFGSVVVGAQTTANTNAINTPPPIGQFTRVTELYTQPPRETYHSNRTDTAYGEQLVSKVIHTYTLGIHIPASHASLVSEYGFSGNLFIDTPISIGTDRSPSSLRVPYRRQFN